MPQHWHFLINVLITHININLLQNIPGYNTKCWLMVKLQCQSEPLNHMPIAVRWNEDCNYMRNWSVIQVIWQSCKDWAIHLVLLSQVESSNRTAIADLSLKMSVVSAGVEEMRSDPSIPIKYEETSHFEICHIEAELCPKYNAYHQHFQAILHWKEAQVGQLWGMDNWKHIVQGISRWHYVHFAFKVCSVLKFK